jgi:DNA segregation ATPase FtsK/SpoIIIE, S-DNA-T family
VVGIAGWAASLVLIVWGVRLAAHRAEDRLISRLPLSPLWIALFAVWASTLTPGADWAQSFGLGGLFGDTVLGLILTVMPVGTALAVNLWSVLLFIGTVAFGGWILGFTKPELLLGWRYLIAGLVLAYELVLQLLGRGASLSLAAAQGAQGRAAQALAARREARLTAAPVAEPVYSHIEQPRAMPPGAGLVRRPADLPPEPPVTARQAATAPRAMPPLVATRATAPEPVQKGFLAGLLRRAAPQAQEPEPVFIDPGLPQDERVRSRIAAAIRARGPVEPAPVLPRGPRPLILDTMPKVPVLPEPPPLAPFVESDLDVIEDDENIFVEDTAWQPPTKVVDRPRVVQPPARKAPVSTRARAEAQPQLPLDAAVAEWEFPPMALLANPANVERHVLSDEALEENARMLESVLDDYGVKGEIVSVRPGPVVTMYELEPAPGLKASRVIGLADDIARSMSALSARVSTVPGRSVIGIELPNVKREKVVLREIISARDFGDSAMRLPLALGKDIAGEPIVANLAKMPHLLIAGTTGSGKSVAINTMILSLLYKLTPQECRLIMIDPKMLELSVYDGIPHLLSPVVTDPKKAVVALKWVVGEMEERYRKMSRMGVRNIEGHNGRVREALAKGEMFSRTVQTGFDEDTGDPVFETSEYAPELLPYIVVIVDEMADLMMVAGKEIEACIQRLAQMARASGIHLIMATQRPSVDVITGTIKANFPTRISFQVTSKIDSRTILGEMGAEQLLGMGDMLYMAGGGRITRIHGPFVSDEEVEEIVTHLKAMGPPEYFSGVVDGPAEEREDEIDAVLGLSGSGGGETDDALYDMAVQIVAKDRKCSTSYIQRKLAIGYNKAARLVEQMEDNGVVTRANHVGKREILVPEVG